jgi:hypothetical protein
MRAAEGTTVRGFDATRADDREPSVLSEKAVKRIAWVAFLMLGAFLTGFVPGWLSANGYEFERDQLVREARAAEIRTLLASSAVNASLGRFDDSLKQVGQFFDAVQIEIASSESAFNEEEKTALQQMLEQRIDLIATVARGEPSAVERLGARYLELEKLSGGGVEK